MIKVVILSAEPDTRGGGERYLLDVVRGLGWRFEFMVVSPKAGELSSTLSALGVKTLIVPTGWNTKVKNFLSNQIRYLHLAAKLRELCPDVIYANAGHTNNLAVRIGARLRVPVVTHVHDVFDLPRGDKFQLARSDRRIACSRRVQEQVLRFASPVEIIYNGVDLARFSRMSGEGAARFRRQLGISDEARVIGIVGTLVRKKGLEEFIEVALRVVRDLPDAVFVIAGATKPGEESYGEELKAKVRALGLADSFRWTGFVEQPESVMSGLDVFLFPAHSEAFGRVLIEAMACGAVVVATRCGGPEEIIDSGRTGFLRPVGDVAGLAEDVVRLCRSSGIRSAVALAARHEVEQRFALEAMLDKVSRMIDEVCEQRKG